MLQAAGGVPVLDAACARDGLADVQGRDPRPGGAADDADAGPDLTVAMDWDGQQHNDDYRQGMLFNLGQVWRRDGAPQQQTVHGNATGRSSTHALSLDGALFPAHHPGGRGTFAHAGGLTSLLRQRIQQLWSPFKLVKEYLLVMFQVRCVACRRAARVLPACQQCIVSRKSRAWLTLHTLLPLQLRAGRGRHAARQERQ